mmetsp:Transcript_12338/g.36403  ORF Transcript_12338/g.36403 Transcript_12338/m.36403 type:complete len:229 (+) Transcript_12338:414-1100(+)
MLPRANSAQWSRRPRAVCPPTLHALALRPSSAPLLPGKRRLTPPAETRTRDRQLPASIFARPPWPVAVRMSLRQIRTGARGKLKISCLSLHHLGVRMAAVPSAHLERAPPPPRAQRPRRRRAKRCSDANASRPSARADPAASSTPPRSGPSPYPSSTTASPVPPSSAPRKAGRAQTLRSRAARSRAPASPSTTSRTISSSRPPRPRRGVVTCPSSSSSRSGPSPRTGL